MTQAGHVTAGGEGEVPAVQWLRGCSGHRELSSWLLTPDPPCVPSPQLQLGHGFRAFQG